MSQNDSKSAPTPPTMRARSYEWRDPLDTATQVGKLSGLEFLTGIIDGRLAQPPMAHTMGFRLTEVAEGLAVFTVEPQDFHYNPIGVVHGGLAATILDSAMACSVHSTLPQGRGYTTLELKVNLVRGITDKGGPLRCEGRVIHVGRQVGTAEGKLIDANGRLYAHGTTTCLIFDVKG